ncbi:hypothetical protein TNCV_1631371 [Trichonephila clavipes]|nr:hypothetical protein TNCV_1631371 [Trichonephila clavipes]
MATGSYMTPTYSRSQSEVQGDLHNSNALSARNCFTESTMDIEALSWGKIHMLLIYRSCLFFINQCSAAVLPFGLQRHDGRGRPRAPADQEDQLVVRSAVKCLIHRYQPSDVRPAHECPP